MKNIESASLAMKWIRGSHLRRASALSAVGAAVLASSALEANPTGGTVASGAATISGSGTSSVTITQGSNLAVINWNSFSINSNELTTFLQPSSSSAVLNRVTGGGTSILDGTLNANGQVFLINGNGILVGKSGVINTNGFLGSTQDIKDSAFLAGKLQFSGNSANAVQNLGTINALGGDIYLIGNTVDNEGSLSAAGGTVGLAAGKSVLIKPNGSQHVFVKASPTAIGAAGADAINNSGLIAATTAELRAANGNLYALAINNSGTVRATTLKSQGGHIFLTSDSGTIVNTGSLNASATAAKGQGGQITLKTTGTVVHHGQIVAQGGQGGVGGTVDLSGASLDFTGGVNLTAAGGKTGNLLLDPTSITVVDDPNANGTVTTTGTTTTYTPAPNFPNPELYNGVLEAQLGIANVIIDGTANVTIAAPVTWTSASSLTLETTGIKGTIAIDAAISGHSSTDVPATLFINSMNNGLVTTSLDGTIDMDNFTMENGIWRQILTTTPLTAKTPGGYIYSDPNNPVTLPTFNVTNDFQLDGKTTFERFAGGNGKPVSAKLPNNGPYQITDIYGLQGIGSPSDTLLGYDYIQDNDINYAAGEVTNSTVYWNGGNSLATTTMSGAGFVPIGEGGAKLEPFTGVYNGNNYVIGGFAFYRPSDNLSGLFAESSGTVNNVLLDVVDDAIQGEGITGILVGRQVGGTIENSEVGLGLAGEDNFTPAMETDGTTANQSEITGNLGVTSAAGSIAGESLRGTILDSVSNIGFELLPGPNGGNESGLNGEGGLVGVNYGTIIGSYSTSSGFTAVDVTQATASATDFKDNSISLGGLVGANYGVIDGSVAEGASVGTGDDGTSIGSLISGPGNFYVGGLVGSNFGTIDGTTVVKVNGKSVRLSYQSVTDDNVTVAGSIEGGTGSYYVGGFVGGNYGTITNAYSAPTINDSSVGPLAAGTNAGIVSATGSVTGGQGNYAVGGFAGGNFRTIIHSGTDDTVNSSGDLSGIATVTTGTTTASATVKPPTTSPLLFNSLFTGGFVGLNGAGAAITQSFSSDHNQIVNFTLSPDSYEPPMAAQTGRVFVLSPDGGTDNPLVSSTGVITGGAGFSVLGGFAGGNFGTVATSFADGNVAASGTTSQSNSFYTGGLVGFNRGNVTNAYALGNVDSTTTIAGGPNNQTGIVGGLIGASYGGNVVNTYELGQVTGGITRGGLLGLRASGAVTGSFFDLTSNAPLTYSAGGTGESETDLMTTTSLEPTSIYGHAHWNFSTIWTVGSTAAYPTLQHVP